MQLTDSDIVQAMEQAECRLDQLRAAGVNPTRATVSMAISRSLTIQRGIVRQRETVAADRAANG